MRRGSDQLIRGQQKSFDHYLERALIRIAREWVKVGDAVLTELKRVASKLPAPTRYDLTLKNKQFLRQFDDPQALRRLRWLPEQLWKEVKNEIRRKPNFRTLAKAQAAPGTRASYFHIDSFRESLGTGVR